jgi:hypothetical protein
MFLVPVASATTVYRSVGVDGVVVFSDQPPASGTDAEVLHIPVSPSQADADARLQELRAANDRLAQARREREAARAASPEPTVRNTAPVASTGIPAALPAQPVQTLWPYPFPRRHYLGPLRPRPGLPVRVPPARVPPGFKVLQPGNQQLMRPIVSSRD